MPTTQLNPYLNRRPVTVPDEFHGRDTIITELLQRTITSTSEPQSCLLLGMRRVGKSSILHFLKQSQGARARFPEYFPPDSQAIMVYIDTTPFSGRAAAVEKEIEPELLRAMTRGLVREAEAVIEALPPGRPTRDAVRALLETSLEPLGEPRLGRFKEASAELLYDVLEKLHDGLHEAGYRTIYLIDGIDTGSQPWPESLATHLRYYFNAYSVAYVIASLRPMRAVLERGESSELFNVFNTVVIGPLMEEAAVALLRTPLRGQDEGWSDDFIHALLEEVGTHPDLLKMAAARAWALRDASGDEPAIESVLEAIRPDMERLFDSIFKHFDPKQKSELRRSEPNLTAVLLASHNAVAQGARLGQRFHGWVRRSGPDEALPTLEGNRLLLEGRVVELTPIEQQLVARLLTDHGRAVSRQTLQAEIWSERDAKSKALDTTIQRLRDKLGDDRADPRWILTVRGHGYAFGPLQGNTIST